MGEPQQGKPGAGAEDRVGGDATGVVARDPRDETRSHDRQECDETAATAEPPTQPQELALLEAIAETGDEADRGRCGSARTGAANPPDAVRRLAGSRTRLPGGALDRGQLRHGHGPL